MKKYLSYTLFYYLVPALLFIIAYEALYRSIPNNYTYKKGYMEEYSEEIETLILGSSHSYYGVNPAYFSSNTFNLAMYSQLIYYDVRLLEKYETKLSHLKYIIYPVSYFSLFERKLHINSDEWIKNYTLYYNINSSNSIRYHFEFLNGKYKFGIKNIFKYLLKGENQITCQNNGWEELDNKELSSDYIIKTGKLIAEKQTHPLNKETKRYMEENNKDLNNMIEWAQKNNVKIILFFPPAFKEYTEHLNYQQLELTIKHSEALAKKYSNCFYYNFLNDTTFTAKDFYDADHLSNKGAQKLSKKLNAIITSD